MKDRSLEEYLKELRKSCGYSQEFVASHLNITRQTYSHYETGRITPPVNSLYNLSKLYGLPVENFLELVVTYKINMDFAIAPQALTHKSINDLSDFADYINAPCNIGKFKHLDRRERMLLYYFAHLDTRDQDDILAYLQIKYQLRPFDPPKESD